MSHVRAALLERRAATAGEKVPQSSVSESFYNFFPSFNSDKQQKLEVRRQEYFDYLKQVGWAEKYSLGERSSQFNQN